MRSKQYPDLSDIYAKREAGRKTRARMPIEKKLEIMDKLRAAADEFKLIRRRRAETDRAKTDGDA
jgi:hypothetical protein